MERQDISPAAYHMLQNSLPTSASVERSFSMFKKLLARDRNFNAENVRHYLILHLNKSTSCLLACRVNYDLFCNSNRFGQQVSLRNCVCFGQVNICFNIKSQKIWFIRSKFFRSMKSIFLIFQVYFFFVFRSIKTCLSYDHFSCVYNIDDIMHQFVRGLQRQSIDIIVVSIAWIS